MVCFFLWDAHCLVIGSRTASLKDSNYARQHCSSSRNDDSKGAYSVDDDNVVFEGSQATKCIKGPTFFSEQGPV